MTKRLSAGTFKGWPSGVEPLSTFAAGELMRLLRGHNNGDYQPLRQ